MHHEQTIIHCIHHAYQAFLLAADLSPQRNISVNPRQIKPTSLHAAPYTYLSSQLLSTGFFLDIFVFNTILPEKLTQFAPSGL